jgi:BspA type Leucine rich repeat region (6 copies)
MKIKLIRLFVALALLALPALVQAQLTFTTNNGAITITGYNTAAGLNMVIPAATNGYPVTSIGNYAFESSGITNVTISNSVISIGDYAFGACISLTNITVSASNPAYSSLNGVMFDKAQATLVQFPGGLGGNYTIPNSVASIGNGAFDYCPSLTSVIIPNSVTSIGDSAFNNCRFVKSAYFQGNAPPNNITIFQLAPATVYYLPGTTGWGAMFDGRPTAPWFLPNPQILNFEPGFGIQPGGFGFIISWATNVSVVVQAATNLASPVWIPVSTNPLTGGTNYFSDPQWTNYPGRFYRVTSTPTFPGFTGNMDVDMYNAAVADGTANGGVPAVMLTDRGRPFKVTAAGPPGSYSRNVAQIYAGWAVFTHVMGTTSCSSTTLPSGPYVIQFGTPLECGFGLTIISLHGGAEVRAAGPFPRMSARQHQHLVRLGARPLSAIPNPAAIRIVSTASARLDVKKQESCTPAQSSGAMPRNLLTVAD